MAELKFIYPAGLMRPPTYTPVVADENLMVTLSNASAITVTLPQDSAVAFPIGAEVDFLWLGVGQPTLLGHEHVQTTQDTRL